MAGGCDLVARSGAVERSACRWNGNTGDGISLKGGSVNFPNELEGNKAFANGGNGLVVAGSNVDANVDGGGNSSLANAGPIQCQIAGVACQ
jgi:hypothetical protein